jgi:hypothetical protein
VRERREKPLEIVENGTKPKIPRRKPEKHKKHIKRSGKRKRNS